MDCLCRRSKTSGHLSDNCCGNAHPESAGASTRISTSTRRLRRCCVDMISLALPVLLTRHTATFTYTSGRVTHLLIPGQCAAQPGEPVWGHQRRRSDSEFSHKVWGQDEPKGGGFTQQLCRVQYLLSAVQPKVPAPCQRSFTAPVCRSQSPQGCRIWEGIAGRQGAHQDPFWGDSEV